MAAAGTLAAGTGVLTAALFLPAPASASSNQTWTGNGDGSSWSDGMNWASMSVPQNGDSVTIPAVRFPARTAEPRWRAR
jgi:asparagine N-glycosylation enzyme membrane subunit Stt3